MSEQIKDARKILRKAFEKDIDLKNEYVANIAMVIFDDMLTEKIVVEVMSEKTRLQVANDTAGKIIDKIF